MTLLSVGASTVIVWVGVPILIGTALAWWAFAAFERTQADFLLGTEIGHAPRPWRTAHGAWGRIKALFGSASIWKDLAFLFLKFPLGVATFVLLTVGGSVPLWLATAPLHYRFDSTYDAALGRSVPGMSLGIWTVDTLPEALLLVPVGLLLFFVALHLLNALAHIWRMLVTLLLEGDDAAVSAKVSVATATPATVEPAAAAPAQAPATDAAPTSSATTTTGDSRARYVFRSRS